MSGQSKSQGAGATTVALVVFLFFAWGFITVLNDPLIAKLRGLFSLTYTEAMLTQFAFFLGYFVFSIPAGVVLAKIGYVRGIVLGLIVMAIGCALFAPAAMSGIYIGFLGALFIVAAGITMLQVAANPYIALLGSQATSHSRLTLAQAFNSLGTFIGPFIGAMFFLQRGVDAPTGANETDLAAARGAEAGILLGPFLVIAVVLALLALLFWVRRNAPGPSAEGTDVNPFNKRVLTSGRLMLGVVAIFLYVGAEVSIGSGLTNYLMQDNVIGREAESIGQSAAAFLSPIFNREFSFHMAQIAGAMVSIYWGLAMVGRFIGSAVLAKVSPGIVLCVNALAAVALAIVSSQTTGIPAAAAVLAIGLANSIMFPTIFTLALEGLGDDVPKGSGLLCMAIVGGALVPLVYGATADQYGLGLALLVPAACYALIAGYGLLTARSSASGSSTVRAGH